MGSVQGKEVDGVLFMEKSKINDLNMGNNSKPGLKFVTVPTSTAVVSRAYVYLCNVKSDTGGTQWLSGRVLDWRLKGRRFKPHRRHCIVYLMSKNINSILVLVQPRKTRPFISERLLMGRKELDQTNKNQSDNELIWDLLPLTPAYCLTWSIINDSQVQINKKIQLKSIIFSYS